MKIFFILILSLFSLVKLSAQVNSEIYIEGAKVVDIAGEGDYLWVATYGQGIYRYSKSEVKWVNFSTKGGNLDNDLFYSIEVNKDYVWAGSAEGLFIFDKKRIFQTPSLGTGLKADSRTFPKSQQHST